MGAVVGGSEGPAMSALATQHISITLPLYRWLMLMGALSNMPDQSWYDALIDQVMNAVQP